MLQPLVSHYPPVLFIQAVSQSHLALTLCQHCSLTFHGQTLLLCKPEGHFFVEHVAICILYNYYLLHFYDHDPPPPPQSYAMCPESSPSSCDSTTHSNSCNLESQMKLALFPTGILENTWVACSKATLNCCIDQLFTFTEMSVKTAFETGKKIIYWLMLADFDVIYVLNWISWQHFGIHGSKTVSHNPKPLPLLLSTTKDPSAMAESWLQSNRHRKTRSNFNIGKNVSSEQQKKYILKNRNNCAFLRLCDGKVRQRRLLRGCSRCPFCGGAIIHPFALSNKPAQHQCKMDHCKKKKSCKIS